MMSGPLADPATTASRRAAALTGLTIIAMTAALLPIASRPVGAIAALQPMFATFGVVTQTLTAVLLFAQFRVTGDVIYGRLAGAYLFAVVMIALHLASFPGVFGDPAPFGITRQGTVWAWTLWHAGFPALVIGALAARGRQTHRLAPGLLPLIASPLAALLLAALALPGGGVLPPLVPDDPDATLRISPAAAAVVAVNLLAIILCVRQTRLRDRLNLWLTVALLASLADTLLTLGGTMRFSVGWYAARAQSAIAASVVLGVLLWEIASLYRRLLDSHRALQDKAIRDGLTAAFNRGYFSEQLPREFRRSCRLGRPLSLLMVDVDHFKPYNDHAGHLAGDRVLIALVDAFRSSIRRPTDFVARYGGEEFAVVLPDTDEAGALAVAHAMRAAVRDLALPRSDDHGPIVTVSIGVATLSPLRDDGQTPEDLVDQADDALYRAKHRGRDGVVAHQSAAALLARREVEMPD